MARGPAGATNASPVLAHFTKVRRRAAGERSARALAPMAPIEPWAGLPYRRDNAATVRRWGRRTPPIPGEVARWRPASTDVGPSGAARPKPLREPIAGSGATRRAMHEAHRSFRAPTNPDV